MTDLLSAALAEAPTIDGAPLRIQGRAKTLKTLREKLRREKHLALPNIRDCAGVRIVGNIALRQQDEIANAIPEILQLQAPTQLVDRRAHPVNGYRALHAVAKVGRVPIEIQIRTVLQHKWADTFELYADIFGREMRYLPEAEMKDSMRDVTVLMKRKSQEIASTEDLVLNDLFGFSYQRAAALKQIEILPAEQREARDLLQMVEKISVAQAHASTMLQYHNAWLDQTKLKLTPISRDVAALNAQMAALKQEFTRRIREVEAKLRAEYHLPDDFQLPPEDLQFPETT